MKIETAILIYFVGLAFSAGVFYAVTRAALAQLRRDMNGIGDKGQQTYLKLMYVAMMLSPEEKRQEVLNALVRRLT